jgi:hypothetical protein
MSSSPSSISAVKQKALALLTEVYKTETGDVKRMAMSLLQTLYAVEDEELMPEMEVKIQKLLKTINEQKNEATTFEIDAPEENPSESAPDALREEKNESPKPTEGVDDSDNSPGVEEDSNTEDSSAKDLKEFSELDGEEENAGKDQGAFVKQAMLQKEDSKRWKWPNLEMMENLRKQDFKQSKENLIKGWRESTSKIETKIENIDFRTSRERIINGWRESTSKLQTLTRRNMGTKDDDSSSDISASTDVSSDPPSPAASENPPSRESRESSTKEDDLLDVIRLFVKEGNPNSRASLEQALSTKQQNAKNKWTETREKWNWPTRAQAS